MCKFLILRLGDTFMSIKKNFTYNFIYQLLILIIPLITMPYVSRIIGAEGVGIYSYVSAISNYFILFSMLGLNNYGNRSIAKVRDDILLLSKTFWEIYFLQILTCLTVIILYISYIFIIRPQYYEFLIIQILFVSSSLLDINWLFFGLEKFKLTITRNIFIKVITVVSIFLLVREEADLLTYIVIISVSSFLSQLALWPYLKKFVIWKKPCISAIFSHIKPNLILFIPVISISLYKIMDKLMLGSFSNVLQLGYYENAEKINQVQISLATALGTVMLPRMSNLVAKDNMKEYKIIIRNSMQFVMFLSMALCFGIMSISKEFIPIFLGGEFEESIKILNVLAPAGIFVSWANVIRTQYLIPNSNDRVYVISVILGAITNLIFNIIFIPKLGAVGAAIGTLVAECTVMLYQTISTRKLLDINQYIKDSTIFILSGIIMLLFVRVVSRYVNNSIPGIIIEILAGAFIYLIIILAYFVIFNKKRLDYLVDIITVKSKP